MRALDWGSAVRIGQQGEAHSRWALCLDVRMIGKLPFLIKMTVFRRFRLPLVPRHLRRMTTKTLTVPKRRLRSREAVARVLFQNGITGTHAIGWRVGSFY